MKNAKLKSIALISLFSCLLIFYGCSGVSKNEKFENEGISKLSEKYKCDNVDDCISKYQFEGARAYMAAEGDMGIYQNLPKITQAEATYWAKQNEFQKAIDVINEANQVNYTEQDKQELKFTIYDAAVNKYCEEGDFKKAKIFALKASDMHNIRGYDKRGMGETDWNEKETQQKVLLKKIKDYQTALKE